MDVDVTDDAEYALDRMFRDPAGMSRHQTRIHEANERFGRILAEADTLFMEAGPVNARPRTGREDTDGQLGLVLGRFAAALRQTSLRHGDLEENLGDCMRLLQTGLDQSHTDACRLKF